MKKLLFVLPILALLFFPSCEKDEINNLEDKNSEIVQNLETDADLE